MSRRRPWSEWALGLVVVFYCGAAGAAEFTEERFSVRADAEEKTSHEVLVRVPEGVRNGERLPLILLFGGFEHAAEVLDQVNPSVPVILASFDYPYQGPRKIRFPAALLEVREYRKAIRMTEALILASVERLKSHPKVDSSRIAIVGASFGAPFALRAAAQTPLIDSVILVHGFADIRGMIRWRLARIYQKRLGWLAKPAASLSAFLIVALLDPPVPEEDAARLRASQHVLLIEALDDTFIPRTSRDALWGAIESSDALKKRIAEPGDHLQPGARDIIERIMALSVDWLKERGWFSKVS